MEKYFNKGKLTIRAALYLDAILISFVMGFSAPITVQYFVSHVTPELISSLAIVLKIGGVLISYIKQSKKAIRWIADNFIKLMIICDCTYLFLALTGESNPEMRYILYNLIGVLGVKLLQSVKKDNIANCLKGTAIINFSAKCDTCGLIAALAGAGMCVIVLQLYPISITTCMLIETIGCMLGHWNQAYANKRIREIKPNIESFSLVEVINDLAKDKKDKTQKEEDSIFDQ